MGSKGRYCYLRAEALENALQEPKVLDALVGELGVPGKAKVLKNLSIEEKLDALARQAAVLTESPTSEWHGCEIDELLAASIYRAGRLSDRFALSIFNDTKKESDLAAPVAAWLLTQGSDVYAEVPMGTKRVDLLGVRPGGLFRSEAIVSVELKNEYSQLKRGLDQMATFLEYSHRVYLACTPSLAAQYLNEHASAKGVRHWDAKLLERRLQEFGFGLLLVEGTEVFEDLVPRKRTIDPKKHRELQDALSTRPRL